MIKKRNEEAPLDALRILLKTQHVELTPIVNQISALPIDDELEYYFIPMDYMKEYSPYYRPGQPYKNLKLINFNRPAISLSFFSKHKYSIVKNPPKDEVLLHLKNYRDELLNYSLFEQLSRSKQQELQRVDELYRSLRNNPGGYEACLSNYHHYYKYWYCACRYFEDATLTKTGTLSEHMLKHTGKAKGQINERLNIIFIDPKYITRPVPYDNKLVDRELANYPTRLKLGTMTLYIREG
ncbi:hypothetical protein F5984_23615 [Rudanella paleaurantiibacter]|uniref:Uncharacterized protein n=2 Tax=Rudanella paleaurantiibacter TaxID=2614655 RepID=A0A7J5TTM9_9BACT|nr:hypothetical protein F5984_23615 [Rudanella paleaurantiibacter]